jgi:hypothetical protein
LDINNSIVAKFSSPSKESERRIIDSRVNYLMLKHRGFLLPRRDLRAQTAGH